MKQFAIVEQPIDTEWYRKMVHHPHAGAVLLFTGHVREWTNDKRTIYLTYEAYIPMAEKKLAEIGAEITEKWPDTTIAIAHRIGKLAISDIAVVVAVSAPHRKSAYEANEYAMKRVKEVVPIWKKEKWEDGEEWIGHQTDQPRLGGDIQ